ncbi:5-deoxy-glucuronate isomerase, partial [Streptomyces sp. NPDC059981]
MPVVSETGMELTRLRVLELAPGETYAHDCGDAEWIVLPLSGGCRVRCPEAEAFELRGRPGVFDGPTDFAYLPRDGRAEVT